MAASVCPKFFGITFAGNPDTTPLDAGSRIFAMMYSGVWAPAMFERSGPTGLAPIAPALWQATQVPLPTNTAWPALGSPGNSSAAAPPA